MSIKARPRRKDFLHFYMAYVVRRLRLPMIIPEGHVVESKNTSWPCDPVVIWRLKTSLSTWSGFIAPVVALLGAEF